MSKYWAHNENEQGLPHLLKDHLRCVGDLAERFAATANQDLAIAARWAGLLHDLGKYRDEFQEYLRGERESSEETHHAVYGAAFAFKRRWLGLAYAIAAHHAGLHDATSLKELINKPAYRADEALPSILERFEQELGNIPENIAEPEFLQTGDGQQARIDLYIRMVFSALVDADFLDTESHYQCQLRRTGRTLDDGLVAELLDRLNTAREFKARNAPRQGKAAEIVAYRNAIYEQCLRAGRRSQGFFSLTVPTGGAKTLNGAAFALSHAQCHRLKRLIVVIPYLSIIEQNAAEYRRIFDPENGGLVIENHSAVVIPAENEEEKSTSEARRRSPLVLAAENWDAPIVVTTAVQFIESLFSSRTSRCRKLHNIAQSVVLLDEVQTLPCHLLDPLLSALRELRDRYGVSFVFSSATQPAFRRQYSLANGFAEREVTEITENTEELFKALRRVHFELPQPGQTRSWSEIAEELQNKPQALCIVNTRKHAFSLWTALRVRLPGNGNESVFHLSSAMCAEHRLALIGEIHNPREGSIRWRLQRKLPCRVASTQLVEAGVDLDFPLLYRALGPLDSIVQAAGRCNRESLLTDEHGAPALGRVIVFIPDEDKKPGGVYKTATEETAAMIAGLNDETIAEDPELFARYFGRLYTKVATDYVRSGETTIQQDRQALDFRKVSSKARVIADDTIGVIAPYGSAPEIIQAMREKSCDRDRPNFFRDEMRRLQRFIVNIRQNDFNALQKMGQIESLLPFGKLAELFVLKQSAYHPLLGVVIAERPPEDLII